MQVLERTGAPFVVTRPTLPVAGFNLAPRGIVLEEDAVSVQAVESF
jgi:hypothetical protein